MVLGNEVLTFKQFLHRQEVLKLYRTILKTIRQVADVDSRQQLLVWAKEDFRTHRSLTDPHAIKSQVKHAEALLNELQQSIALSQ